MKIEELMMRHGLTGDPVEFVAAVREYEADRHRPTPSEQMLIQQVAGDLGDLLDQGVALGALRGGGVGVLHTLAQKVRHQAGRAAPADTKPTPDQAAAALTEQRRRKMNQRRHVVPWG